MDQQKYQKGDHIMIDKDLGSMMSHFTADAEAIVIGSYKDQFGGSDTKSYTLHIKDRGKVSWYYEHQLTLIEANRSDLLEQWETKEKELVSQQSDLDWIFTNGKEVVDNGYGTSIQALADVHNFGSLWGSNGEGVTYLSRSIQILEIAMPYLISGDRKAYEELVL